jgi:hypothetical protein
MTEGRLLDLGGDEAGCREDIDGRELDWRDFIEGAGFLMEMDITEGRVRGWEYIIGVAISIGVSGSRSGISRSRSGSRVSSRAKSGG